MTGPQHAFLAAAGWGGAAAAALAGDASARRYMRLTQASGTAILMLAPPGDRAAFDAFVDIATRLRGLGLSAPRIYASDPAQGLMLLEDLGEPGFHRLHDALPEAALAATDVLIGLARQEPWPLPVLTPAVMAGMTRIALPDGPATEDAIACMETLFTARFRAPLRPALRDVHAENLIWLPGRSGVARVGLLDFQDAVMAPPGYDLVSFIHDARRDVPGDIARAMTDRFTAALNHNPEAFAAEAAVLSFQRNLRILGVFRSLARDRGKPAYLTYLPRVFAHVESALEHPALRELAEAMRPLMPGLAP